jgi:Tfp pilus assembly protein PilF
VAKKPARNLRLWLLLPALLIATLAAYHPAWRGGVLWDDDDHMTPADLRGVSGLGRIWFEVGAAQQYYPVVHSTFWALDGMVGHETLAYHLLNIALHAISAFLLALVLKRLAFPTAAAVLAAAIFALHPVHVESVAWITELKNTMSGVFYLAAALVYLRFDRDRRTRDYALAISLFVVALLSKTVTATLPAGLLVVFWWQRGRLDLQRDVRPLVPFFAIGAIAGLTTAWVEHTFIGARTAEHQLAIVERFLIAGRATWFYLGKLLWPADLTFIYPRWTVDQGVWWQYLFPLGVAGTLIALWQLRHRSRAPFAAAAFFILTLAPALGFINVYPFRYSFVADHFQYLASIGIITLVSAGLVELARRRHLLTPTTGVALVVGFAAVLGPLTWRQSRQYIDAETLYRTTIARNPLCWMCHNNLGVMKLGGSIEDLREGQALIEKSIELHASNAEAHNNLGFVLQALGRPEEAFRAHQTAIRIDPNFADAHNSLGADLLSLERLPEAERELREALRLKPNYPSAHHNLSMVLFALNRSDEALVEAHRALALDPNDADARLNLGRILLRQSRLDDALAQFQEAARLKTNYGEAHHNAGFVFQQLGRLADAAREYDTAVRLMPDSARSHNGLGYALIRLGRPAEAASHLEIAVRLQPGDPVAHFNLANAWLDLGRAEAAVAEYRETLKYEPPPGAPETHNNLGIALAQLGRIAEAIPEFQAALRINPEFADARANLARARGGR